MMTESGGDGSSLGERVRQEQRERWEKGERIPAEYLLAAYPDLRADEEGALDLLYQEVLLREEVGEKPLLAEYLRRFPRYAERLRRQFELHAMLADESMLNAIEDSETEGAGAAPSVRNTPPKPPTPPASGPVRAGTEGVPSGYEVLGELGRSRAAVVYQARHQATGRMVALKVFLAGGLLDVQLRKQFLAEAEVLARQRHAGIVRVYELGTSGGHAFLATEFVDGVSLRARLASGPMTASQATQLVGCLARAVGKAHQHGILHRDLRPSNVLLTKDGAPKIADFGLAGPSTDSTAGENSSPEALSYTAPEQVQADAAAVGPAADVYALGSMLYELLTGRPPFRGPNVPSTLRQVLHDDPVSPRLLQPDTPPALEAICLCCLQKDPRRRYPSADELADDLARFAAGTPVRARIDGPFRRFLRWCRLAPAR